MDRQMAGLVAFLLVVAVVVFFTSNKPMEGTAERVRESVRNEVHETADRLDSAFDAAKKDIQNLPSR